MEPITFISNLQGDQRSQLVERFLSEVGAKLPSAYIERARIVGCMQGGKIVGGYMLIMDAPFRGLLLIPDKVKQEHPLLADLDQQSIIEINGFWIQEDLRKTAVSTQIWARLRADILRSKASKVLAFYNAKAIGLDRFYSQLIGPNYVFEGAPQQVNANSQSHATIKVGLIDRRMVWISPVLYYRREIKRFFAKKPRQLAS